MRFPILNSITWLHSDLQAIIYNRLPTYILHNRIDLKERAEIQWQWNKIKDQMDEALKEMDQVVLSHQNKSQTHHTSSKTHLV